MCELAASLNISDPEKSNLKQLRQNIQRRVNLKGLLNGSDDLIRVLKMDVQKLQPTAEVIVNNDLFVADLQTKAILQIAVEKNITAIGYELCGNLLCSISISAMRGCFGLAYRMNFIIMSDHSAGTLRIELGSNDVSIILAILELKQKIAKDHMELKLLEMTWYIPILSKESCIEYKVMQTKQLAIYLKLFQWLVQGRTEMKMALVMNVNFHNQLECAVKETPYS